MACRVKPGKLWIIIEDPFVTPGAHETTVHMLCISAGVMLLGLLGVFVRACRRDAASDVLHIIFFLVGAVGYACAGIARAAYTAGPNPLLLTARLLLVSSWLGLLVNCCLLHHRVSPSSLKTAAFWTVSACLAIGGLVSAALGLGSDLQFALLFMGGMSTTCACVWFSAVRAKGRQSSWTLRSLFAGSVSVGSFLAGIMEPFCGSLGHSTCYSGCGGSHVIPYLLWIGFSIVGHGGLALCQMYAADDVAASLGLCRKASTYPSHSAAPDAPVDGPPVDSEL